MKKCNQCGEAFEGSKRKKFCSEKCYMRWYSKFRRIVDTTSKPKSGSGDPYLAIISAVLVRSLLDLARVSRARDYLTNALFLLDDAPLYLEALELDIDRAESKVYALLYAMLILGVGSQQQDEELLDFEMKRMIDFDELLDSRVADLAAQLESEIFRMPFEAREKLRRDLRARLAAVAQEKVLDGNLEIWKESETIGFMVGTDLIAFKL